MNFQLLGENIQKIRKFRGMSQQELADAIGINMQSLSKIERGVNHPSFDTLGRITIMLDVNPNELLCGEWNYRSPMEDEILQFLMREEPLNIELARGDDDFYNREQDWEEYEFDKLQEYIIDYITSNDRLAADLYPIKDLIQQQELHKLIDRYDELYSVDLYGETIKGHRNINPYVWNPWDRKR